jgi:hypothetical protein
MLLLYRNLTAAATTFVVTLPVRSQASVRRAARAWEAALLDLIQVWIYSLFKYTALVMHFGANYAEF